MFKSQAFSLDEVNGLQVFKAWQQEYENGKGQLLCLSRIFPLVRLSLGELLLSRARFRFTELFKIVLDFGKDNGFDLDRVELEPHRDTFGIPNSIWRTT